MEWRATDSDLCRCTHSIFERREVRNNSVRAQQIVLIRVRDAMLSLQPIAFSLFNTPYLDMRDRVAPIVLGRIETRATVDACMYVHEALSRGRIMY